MRTVYARLLGGFAVLAAAGPAFAADTDITIVLSEELDLVEPCMATRSNIGRVICRTSAKR